MATGDGDEPTHSHVALVSLWCRSGVTLVMASGHGRSTSLPTLRVTHSHGGLGRSTSLYLLAAASPADVGPGSGETPCG